MMEEQNPAMLFHDQRMANTQAWLQLLSNQPHACATRSSMERLVRHPAGLDLSVTDAEGKNVVHHMTRLEHLPCLKHMITQDKNDPQATQKACQQPDRQGITPLHIAVEKHCNEIAYFLIDQVSPESLEAKDYRHLSPLHMALRTQQWDVLEAMLCAGAQGNVMDWVEPHDASTRAKVASILDRAEQSFRGPPK